VVEAAAQVSLLGLMAPTDATCAARILAAAVSPASDFASTVFLVACAFGDAAVDEGGGGCRSFQGGNRRQIWGVSSTDENGWLKPSQVTSGESPLKPSPDLGSQGRKQ
jgi:hypothetical protein